MARIGRSVAAVLGLLAFWCISPGNVEACEPYTILQDPAGMVFCVVPVQTGEAFEREALTWDD